MWKYRLAIVLCTLLGAGLVLSVPALALSQRGHVFSFPFGMKGKGEDQFSDPSGIAVNDATGDLYVADHKNKRVEEFEPVLNGAGELVSEHPVGAFEAPSPGAVAVDNSTEGSDPSRSDVYVVGANGKAIHKFSAEGAALGVINQFQIGGSKAKFEAIEGIAVDSSGSLFVYQEDGTIYRFNDAASNEVELSLQAGLTRPGRPGFALDAEDNFYAGVQGEGGFPVVSKLEGITGNVLIEELDGEATSAVAVNPADVPANAVNERNDVYVSNGTSIAQFGPEVEGKRGALIQRFGAPGMKEGAGIAVDSQTGTVYVTDAASDNVDVFALEPVGPPKIEDLSAQPVVPPTPTARRLGAQVDPTGSDTHYYFEYGASSCTATPPSCTKTTPTDIGGAFADTEVSLELTGLVPATYHYRVVAESSLGTTASPERTFTIVELPSGLPDGRAWELVSPPERHGAPIEALNREGGLILAAEDGDALTYVVDGSITEEPQGDRAPEPQQVLATRGPEGWSSQEIVTPGSSPQGLALGFAPEYQFFSPDLSLALVDPYAITVQSEPPLVPEATQSTIYLRDDTTGTYLPLVTEANVPAGTEFGRRLAFMGATPDLSHVVLHSATALTEPPSGPGLYEWSAGKLQLVSVLPDGAPAPEATLGYSHLAAHAISSDGTRVIWTASGETPGHLYMRDTAIGETVQLDAAQGVTEPGVGAARFQTASGDASRVFFTDDQRLTPDSTAEPTNEQSDLYECEMVKEAGKLVCHLRDLTVAQTEGERAGVQSLLFGASEDGTSLYLVATGVLATNENGDGESARPGNNLYELHEEGTEWRTTFIAALSSEDSPEWRGNTFADTAFLTARVSPNGRYLAFMTAASPTGYDNVDPEQRQARRGGLPL